VREVELAPQINLGIIRFSWNIQTAQRNGRHGPYFSSWKLWAISKEWWSLRTSKSARFQNPIHTYWRIKLKENWRDIKLVTYKNRITTTYIHASHIKRMLIHITWRNKKRRLRRGTKDGETMGHLLNKHKNFGSQFTQDIPWTLEAFHVYWKKFQGLSQ
jgi:hypothetical protein